MPFDETRGNTSLLDEHRRLELQWPRVSWFAGYILKKWQCHTVKNHPLVAGADYALVCGFHDYRYGLWSCLLLDYEQTTQSFVWPDHFLRSSSFKYTNNALIIELTYIFFQGKRSVTSNCKALSVFCLKFLWADRPSIHEVLAHVWFKTSRSAAAVCWLGRLIRKVSCSGN